METTEITFESHPITYIQMLEQEIKDLKPKRQDYEDNDDLYQANLEYGWYVEEQRNTIADLKKKLTPSQLNWYNEFN